MRAALASLIAFIAFHVVRVRRAHVEASIARAGLPHDAALGMFRELATSLVELVWVALGRITPKDVVHIPEGVIERIQAARAHGPVMLWCAHTSNWELLAMRAGQRFPLALIVKTQGVGLADRFIQRQRARAGLRTILPTGALATARDAFSRGEVVATVIDQVPASRAHGDWADFLGAPALVDRAPAVLARRANAHVFVIFASRAGVNRQVEATLAAELTRDVVASTPLRELMSRATNLLADHVRSHPSSWLWLHRRWRTTFERRRPHAISAIPDDRPSPVGQKHFLADQKEVIESTS